MIEALSHPIVFHNLNAHKGIKLYLNYLIRLKIFSGQLAGTDLVAAAVTCMHMFSGIAWCIFIHTACMLVIIHTYCAHAAYVLHVIRLAKIA